MTTDRYFFYVGYSFKGHCKISPARVNATNLTEEEYTNFSEWFEKEISPLISRKLDEILKGGK
jgi:hypothetical protein